MIRIPNLNVYDSNWIAIREYALAQLAKTREMLENPKLSQDETNVLRGKIQAYKELLGAEKDVHQAARNSPN